MQLKNEAGVGVVVAIVETEAGCEQNIKLLQLPCERVSIASLLNRVEADMIMCVHGYKNQLWGMQRAASAISLLSKVMTTLKLPNNNQQSHYVIEKPKYST